MTTAVTFGPLPAGQGTWIWGWLIVLTGLGFWAGGVAAWTLQPWGWLLGHFLAIFGLIEAIFALLGTGNLNYALAIDRLPASAPLVPEPNSRQGGLRPVGGLIPVLVGAWSARTA